MVGSYWQNVLIANFATGIESSALIGNTRIRVHVQACEQCWQFKPSNSTQCNRNTFLDCGVSDVGRVGFDVQDSAGFVFIGTLIEQMRAGAIGMLFRETQRDNCNDHLILCPWLEHGGDTPYRSIYIDGGRNIEILNAHGGGTATIVIARGTRHRLVGARMTGIRKVIEIGARAYDTAVERMDLVDDVEGIFDQGIGTQINALECVARITELRSIGSQLNTVGKFEGKKVWCQDLHAMYRADGAAPCDTWWAIDGRKFISPK